MNLPKAPEGLAMPACGRIAASICIIVATVGLGLSAAFADDRDHHDNDARNRGHNTAPARHDNSRKAHRPTRHAEYVAPPVYYAPRASPGINIFVPLGHY
jgi:hypothetical protein